MNAYTPLLYKTDTYEITIFTKPSFKAVVKDLIEGKEQELNLLSFGNWLEKHRDELPLKIYTEIRSIVDSEVSKRFDFAAHKLGITDLNRKLKESLQALKTASLLIGEGLLQDLPEQTKDLALQLISSKIDKLMQISNDKHSLLKNIAFIVDYDIPTHKRFAFYSSLKRELKKYGYFLASRSTMSVVFTKDPLLAVTVYLIAIRYGKANLRIAFSL